MTTKNFPRTLIAAEAVLLFFLGILGSRIADWLDLPPAVLIFLAVALLGVLTAVTYAKVNYDPARGVHSISAVIRSLRTLRGSEANEQLAEIARRRSGGSVARFNLFEPPYKEKEDQFDAAFRKSVYRSLVATTFWSIALCWATDLSRALLWVAILAVIAFISSWPLIALPSKARGGERLYEIIGIPFIIGTTVMLVPFLIVLVALAVLGLLPQ